jgi:hypothetical protein
VSSDAERVQEHWTDSHAALVLTGNYTTISSIAAVLQMPETAVVSTRHGQAVLGIWGAQLDAYQELKRQGRVVANSTLSDKGTQLTR